MDITDSHRDILRVIQADATVTLDRLREQVSLSQSTLWRRLKELEESNVIRGRVTLLEPEEVGLSVCAFVSINLTSHIPKHRDAFEKLVDNTKQIMQCYSVTGTQDYILQIRTKDMREYESILMDTLLSHPSVATAASNISIREHKLTTILPL